MMFGRFHFRVGKEGSHRLEGPISSGSSAVDSDLSESSSSFETGDEDISLPRFVKTTASEKLARIFGNMSFESFADSSISSDSDSVDSFSFIDKYTSVGEAFADLYDGVTNPDKVYIDNVVITTKKGSTLIEDLKETFNNLDKFCLKLNPTKCSFGVPAWELLGFLVSERGIEANPEKIQAIVKMRKPTKLKEIQQLMTVAALRSSPVGEKALPFYTLIKQGEKFEWNEERDRAFEDLKRTISTPPILVAPKEKEPLLLYIAATPQVVSTVLVVEREEEGKLYGV
ncbi:hypothetical protein QYE76_058023 [Lolium multiflorum]|uniref:Reverse transcriptase/retrotransposon-derived protein RNase H-like domain-containing protein n=1 Tax=Lolium multiflorum TaxID=4521 RepID=A0AAD8WPB1_LOLMU|nr:hypothetical protein QYE76_058023 [Lolium multiflorum]